MSESHQEADQKSENRNDDQIEDRTRDDLRIAQDILQGYFAGIIDEFYDEYIESNLKDYLPKQLSRKTVAITPDRSRKTISKQPSEIESIPEKTNSRPSVINDYLVEKPVNHQPNLIEEVPLHKEPSQDFENALPKDELSRQPSNSESKRMSEVRKSQKSIAFGQPLSKQVSEGPMINEKESGIHAELNDQVVPLTARSKESRTHSMKERSSRKHFDESMRVSFAEPENLVNIVTASKPLLKLTRETNQGELSESMSRAKKKSVKPILVKEDSYHQEKRQSTNRYTRHFIIASKNVSKIVKELARALSKPTSGIFGDDTANNMGVLDTQNFSRSALDDYRTDSMTYKDRDSLKLSRCVLMNKSSKKPSHETGNETDEQMYATQNFNEDHDKYSDIETQITNLQSLDKISFKKSCIHKAKSGENALRPVVSFVLPFDQPEKKTPLTYQDISSKSKPPLSPTRFPDKKTSNFNKKSSLHQIEEAFFLKNGSFLGQKDTNVKEDNTGTQNIELKIQEVDVERSSENKGERQKSKDQKYDHKVLEQSLRESSRHQLRVNKKSDQITNDLRKAKQATDLILKINLEKQARQVQIEQRQRQELLKFQKQVLASQNIITDSQQSELRNSKVEKILENIQTIQKRKEDRRKTNSKSNHVIKRIQETVAHFYQKPSTIELAEEQRRAIILAKIKSQHQPIDVNVLDQHQKLYEECALLMRAELANKRKVPDQVRASQEKPCSNNVIRRIVERETEIEAQNREMSRIIQHKHHLLETAGNDINRGKYRPERIEQSPRENFMITGGEGVFEDRSVDYKVVSKALPIKNLSSRLKQTIAASLQISSTEQQELSRSNVENRLPVLTDSHYPSAFGKQSFFFNNDVYEAYGMRYSVDLPHVSNSTDVKGPLNNSQRIPESHFKENKHNPVKVSSRVHTQTTEKNNQIVTPLKQKTTLPKIVRGTSHNRRSDPLNPWKSTK